MPSQQGAFNSVPQFIQAGKVAIVSCHASHQFPYPLYWVQFRAVGRKEIQQETLEALFPPRMVELGMVVASIVDDEHYLSSGMRTDRTQITNKEKEAFRIEFVGSMEHELSISESYRPEEADALSGGVVIVNGVFDLPRHPHATP